MTPLGAIPQSLDLSRLVCGARRDLAVTVQPGGRQSGEAKKKSRQSALPRQAHRLFVWSADVLAETQDTPWRQLLAWCHEARAALESTSSSLAPGTRTWGGSWGA